MGCSDSKNDIEVAKKPQPQSRSNDNNEKSSSPAQKNNQPKNIQKQNTTPKPSPEINNKTKNIKPKEEPPKSSKGSTQLKTKNANLSANSSSNSKRSSNSQLANKEIKQAETFNKPAEQINQQFNKAALDEHNKLRKKHQAPELELNTELAKLAQQHSKVLANEYKLVPSKTKFKNQLVGENLCMYADSKIENYGG
jgi:uncharacterized protein YkwD